MVLAACGTKEEEPTATPPPAAAPAPAPSTPPLDPKNIVSIAIASKDHTTLVAALKAADLGDGGDPARGERSTFPQTVDLIEDLFARGAAKHEVCVQGMHPVVLLDRRRRRGKRLGDDLPSEHPTPRILGSLPDKEVGGNALERHQLQKRAWGSAGHCVERTG